MNLVTAFFVLIMLLATSLVAGGGDESYPTKQGIKDAARRSDYPRVEVGDHVLHLPPDNIISSIDFCLGAYGAITEQVEKPGDEATAWHLENRRFLHWNLGMALSAFERARAEGRIRGWTYLELIEAAIKGYEPQRKEEKRQKWYVAALFFLHRWLTDEPDSMSPALEARTRQLEARFADLREHMTLLADESGTHLRELEATAARMTAIETRARELSATLAPGAVPAPEFAAQVLNLHEELMREQELVVRRRDAILTRIAEMQAQIMRFNNERTFHEELCRFLRWFFLENHLLERFVWADLNAVDLELSDELKRAFDADTPTPNVEFWQMLLAERRQHLTRGAAQTIRQPRLLAHPRPQIVLRPQVVPRPQAPPAQEARPGFFRNLLGYGGSSK